MSRQTRLHRHASRLTRRLIGWDQKLGTPEKLRDLKPDEFGFYTIDPDPPHPQRVLLPVAADRQRNDLILPPNDSIPVNVNWGEPGWPPPDVPSGAPYLAFQIPSFTTALSV